MSEPKTLAEAMEDVRAAWRELVLEVCYSLGVVHFCAFLEGALRKVARRFDR